MTMLEFKRLLIPTGRLVRLGLLLLLLTGCHAMNTSTESQPVQKPGMLGYVPTDANGIVHIDTRYPIPFDMHNFGAACYDTYHCKVLYNNMYVADQDSSGPKGEKSISSASLGDKYPDKVLDGAMFGGIRNFPAPAEVTWKSKDGQSHQATVDIGAIFKDQVVLHKVSTEQLPPILTAPVFPDIFWKLMTTSSTCICGHTYSPRYCKSGTTRLVTFVTI